MLMQRRQWKIGTSWKLFDNAGEALGQSCGALGHVLVSFDNIACLASRFVFQNGKAWLEVVNNSAECGLVARQMRHHLWLLTASRGGAIE
jgi:hypothetical protein